MAKRVSFGLSVSGINKAIKDIEKYKQGLNRKVELFCRALTRYGKVTAVQYANASPLGKTIKITTTIEPSQMGCKAMLIGTGQTSKSEGYDSVNTLLLVEFGAGIKHNPVGNPKSGEFGMGVGSFPGQMHAFDSGGWYYLGSDEEWHHSFGIKATMPMYNAGKEMREQISKIAKNIFRI